MLRNLLSSDKFMHSSLQWLTLLLMNLVLYFNLLRFIFCFRVCLCCTARYTFVIAGILSQQVLFKLLQSTIWQLFYVQFGLEFQQRHTRSISSGTAVW